jgi:hypothetical protein
LVSRLGPARSRAAGPRSEKDGIARWLRENFPDIGRAAGERSAYLLLLDQSGFLLTPSVRRTLAKHGHTPVLDVWDRCNRISAISGITVSPQVHRLNLHFQLLRDDASVDGEDVVEYLPGYGRHWGGR